MIRRLLMAAAVGAAVLSSFAAPSLAETTAAVITQAEPLGSSYVNLAPLVSLMLQVATGVLAIVVPGAIAAGARYFTKRTGIAVQDQAQSELERALQMGVNLATNRLQTQFQGKLTVDVHNKLAAGVLTYALEHAPAAVKQLGYDPTRDAKVLAEKAIARLAGAGIVPSGAGPIQAMPPAIPSAPGVGLVTGPGVAPAPAPHAITPAS